MKTSICSPDDMHPYNCLGKGRCIHCDRRRFKGHVPSRCALCNDTKSRREKGKKE